jgi:hypothetical protein
LMGDGDGAFHFSGDGIANFIGAGDGREDDDIISHAHLSIRPLITEKIHLLYS